MRWRLSFQNTQIFRQQLLPVMNNADFYAMLRADLFWLEEDLELHFEILDGIWRIFPSEGCRMYVKSKEAEGLLTEPLALTDGLCLRIRTMNAEELVLRVTECTQLLYPCRKYLLPADGHVRIGGREDCALRPGAACFSEDSLLDLEIKEDDTFLENRGLEPAYRNGAALRGKVRLSFGDLIDSAGIRLIWLGTVLAVRAEDPEVRWVSSLQELPEEAPETGKEPPKEAVIPKTEGLYHRAPRNMEPVHAGEIVIEGPPDRNRLRQVGILQILGGSVLMVLPMLIGCLLMIAASGSSGTSSSWFMYIGLFMAISSAVVGIIWGLLNYRQQKKENKTEETHRFEAYSKYLIGKTDEIRQLYRENKEIMQRMHPAASRCIRYDRYGTELWNRNSAQGDFLQVRIGTGDIPFQVRIEVPGEGFQLYEDDLRDKPGMIRKNYETLFEVPILVNLKKNPLLGLVGGEEKYGAFALMRTMVLQLAATHTYTELKMAFLYDARTEEEKWRFAKWLPHVWSEDRKCRYTGGTPEEISEVCYRLNSIFTGRLEKADRQKEGFLPHYVLFLSDAELIEKELLSGSLYQHAAAAGFSVVLLTDVRETLPNDCTDFLINNETFRGIERTGEKQAVVFDTVSASELEDFARRISGIRVRETEVSGEIPKNVSFLEMYGKTRIEDLDVRERWLKNRTTGNIRGLLGLKGSEEPEILDLHEKYHGPHGLVAGTTGSGKSETLQTYLLSLAVEYSPDDVNFFVIDYKGGGMANLFDALPHMAGSISNLSGARVHRALVSIKSENRRRQRLFNEAGVNNINKYTQAYKEGRIPTPIPHLFIIVDEFAELKREEPDFMRELISVAQVGRSLGVHLILSTQKPSGTVDDNIWSNSRFRICLRVQTKEDSMDMLGKPDAAFLTDAGRGYLQVGNNELYELFQSGYSGAAYDPENSDANREATCLLTGTGQTDLRYGVRERNSRKKEITQLDAVVQYLAQVAAEEGYRETYPMWMPPLKNPLYLEELELYGQSAADETGWKISGEEMRRNWELSAVIGQTDDPQNQLQEPLSVSFSEGGNHAVIGSVVCGKSTLLQTIVYSLVNKYSPEYLNIYAIDYSSRMLSAFENLAHVGGVLYEGDEKKTERFFRLLEEMLKERKKKYRGGNYAQYVRAHGVEEPAVLVVIDHFAAFQERTEEKHLPFLLTLSREGVSNGIYLLIAAGGYRMTEIPNRLADNIGTALPLALPDRYAYGDILHSMRVSLVPETVYRGRGLCSVDGTFLEFQTALALEASDDYQRIEKIRTRCRMLNGLWKGPAAVGIPEIPEKPVWEGFRELPEVQKALADDRFLPIGYYSENARICSLDLYRTYCYLVAGGRRTGKTNLLRLMILAALEKPNGGVVLIDGENRLKDLYHEENLRVIRTEEELYGYCLEELTPLFGARNKKKHVLLDQGLEQEEYYQEMTAEKPVFLFISDLLWFVQAVYRDEHDMRGFMETLFRKGEDHKIYFIGALSLDNRSEAAGFEAFHLFVRYGTGIHLGGNTTQDPFLSFENMSYAEQMKTEPPGTGLIPDTGSGSAPVRVVLPAAAKRRRKQRDRD